MREITADTKELMAREVMREIASMAPGLSPAEYQKIMSEAAWNFESEVHATVTVRLPPDNPEAIDITITNAPD